MRDEWLRAAGPMWGRLRAAVAREPEGARATGRRAFLRFLASSPLAASAAAWNRQTEDGGVTLADVANVLEFEPLARRKLPPAHFGYIATGVDDDATIRANRDGFGHYQIRSRRRTGVPRGRFC